MRYIGSKLKLLSNIEDFISKNITDENTTFCDLFAGTGTVGSYFNQKYKIISNDYMYYSFILNKGKLNYDGSYSFTKLKKHLNVDDIFKYYSDLILDVNTVKESDNNFVFNNYTKGFSDRMYFSNENGLKIDHIRKSIDLWRNDDLIDENEYYYLLMCLIESTSKVSNTTGVYGAYLKKYDSRAIKNMEFLKIEVNDFNNSENFIYNENVNDLIKTLSGDIVYIDPPYTNQQYCDQYHLLETLAKYDSPEIKGITGKRSGDKSLYCYKKTADENIEDLIKNLNFKHIILSYSDQSIVSIERLIEILKKYGIPETLSYEKIVYNAYKNNRTDNSKNNENKLHEYLFYIRKK
jgi:adenine-specific DNA-methyltransferase